MFDASTAHGLIRFVGYPVTSDHCASQPVFSMFNVNSVDALLAVCVCFVFLPLSQLANVSLPTLTDLIYPVLAGSSGLYCPPCVNDHTVSTDFASSALTVLVKLTPNASVAIKVADVTPANALLKTFLIFSIPPLNKT